MNISRWSVRLLDSVLVIFSLVLGVSSCREATAIRVHMFTDVAWENGRRVVLSAGKAPTATAPNAEVEGPWTSTDLGDLVFLPGDDKSGAVRVLVVMGITKDPKNCTLEEPDGCVFSRRKLAFVPYRTLTLPVTVRTACIGIPCSEDTTCNALGQCVPAEVNPNDCIAPGGCILPGDEGTPVDPGPPLPGGNGGPGDGGPGDGGPSDGGPSDVRFCDLAPHEFCADFDEGGEASTGWTGTLLSKSGPTLTLDPTHVSSPMSLLSTVPAAPGSENRARVYHERPTTPAFVRVEADVQLCAVATAGDREFIKLEFKTPLDQAGPGSLSAQITLTSNPSGFFIKLGRIDGVGDFSSSTHSAAPPTGKWVHLRLETTLSETNGTIQLFVDGNTTPDVNVTNVPTLSSGSTLTRLVLGIWSQGTNAGCAVRFDNVTFDTTP
jgi:hypothetical protein